MFQLETQNIRFNYRIMCSKGCWDQTSPKVIQDHLGSLSVKKLMNCKNSYTITIIIIITIIYY